MSTRKRHRALAERIEESSTAPAYIKSECRNEPLHRSDSRYPVAVQLRQRLAGSAFTSGEPPAYAYDMQRASGNISMTPSYIGPTDAYTACFLALLDNGVIELVKRTFADERAAIMRGERLPINRRHPKVIERQQPDESGVVYCFWNILDRPELKKIGRTRRRAEQRGREWEAALSPEEGQQIVMLFAVPTKHNVFSERVVHAALLCEHVPHRVNEQSGRQLTEYYRVNNVMALKLFVMLCVGYIDSWYSDVEHEFQTTSTLYEEWRGVTQSIQ